MDGIKYNMETVDDAIPRLRINFMDKAKADGKPFFVWLNPTRMHIVTHLSPKYEAMRNSKNGWSEEEAGMAQLDDDVGLVMQYLKDMGVDDNTIVVFTTDNGTETLHLARRRANTIRAMQRERSWKAVSGFPVFFRWPGHVQADSVQNGIFSGMDWFPTFLDAAGNSGYQRTSCSRAYTSAIAPTRTISTATTRWLPSPAKVRPHVTKSSILAKVPSARCALTITNIASLTSPKAGWAPRRMWTCPI